MKTWQLGSLHGFAWLRSRGRFKTGVLALAGCVAVPGGWGDASAQVTPGGHAMQARQAAHAGHVHAQSTVSVWQAPALGSVEINDSFWAPKLAQWRSVTINDALDKFERDGAMRMFDHVANGALDEDHPVFPWFDGLMYEMITAASDFLAVHPDPALAKRLDGYVAQIAAAQQASPDGWYVNTYITMEDPDRQWGRNGGNMRWSHDVYNLGCLVEAGVHHYQATGKTELLVCAVKVANGMAALMGPPPKQNIIPAHSAPEKGVVELAELLQADPGLGKRLQGENGLASDAEAYLALVKFWYDNRGNHEGRGDFGSYAQDHAPGLEQQTIEGHAVRATLMAQGMAALGQAIGDPRYVDTAETLWANMAGRRMYLTGGVGSSAHDEKFEDDFVLPNTGYAETCSAVGHAMFGHEVNLATGRAAAVDALERVLYNNVLAGVSADGTHYHYTNPLETGDNHPRWSWHPCPCCPPMFLKLAGALPKWIYATDPDGDALAVNLFVGSKAAFGLAGTSVVIEQQTDYPWHGDVALTVAPEQPAAFELAIRVPVWCVSQNSFGDLYRSAEKPGKNAFVLHVNGQPVPVQIQDGYARIHRTWEAGDQLQVSMAMPVRTVQADPSVEADQGLVAVERGPLVYCLEAIDQPVPLNQLFVPGQADWQPTQNDAVLPGGLVLTGQAQQATAEGSQPVTVTAIPFYANANRGATPMKVWLQTSADQAAKPTLAGRAQVSASHVFTGDRLEAMNDGLEPASSADESLPRFTWWDHQGKQEWAQYTFDEPIRLAEVAVYWWDETAVNRHCRVPLSWQLLYRNEQGQWCTVRTEDVPGTQANAYNRLRFEPVETDALRLVVQLQDGWSGGILEWQVARTAAGDPTYLPKAN